MRLVAPGDLVTDKDSLVQIDAVDRLQAYFAMSEFLLPFAKVGFPVEVMVSPYPGERFPGKVFFVSPTLETNSRRIMVKAWVPNGHGKLAAGLYANIEVEIRRQENALILPESAVVADRLGTFVWRIGDDELAERVPIEVGLRKGGKVEVTRGLHAGDRIVTAGTHKVSVGKKVAAAAPLLSGQASAQAEGEAGEGT
jgi:membrane fusion protein (multidrug efflux system)